MSENISCQSCGQPNAVGTLLCSNCGATLEIPGGADAMRTQAITGIDELLKRDHGDFVARGGHVVGGEGEYTEEEVSAPTEAIDFNALMASGALDGLGAPPSSEPADEFAGEATEAIDFNDLLASGALGPQGAQFEEDEDDEDSGNATEAINAADFMAAFAQKPAGPIPGPTPGPVAPPKAVPTPTLAAPSVVVAPPPEAPRMPAIQKPAVEVSADMGSDPTAAISYEDIAASGALKRPMGRPVAPEPEPPVNLAPPPASPAPPSNPAPPRIAGGGGGGGGEGKSRKGLIIGVVAGIFLLCCCPGALVGVFWDKVQTMISGEAAEVPTPDEDGAADEKPAAADEGDKEEDKEDKEDKEEAAGGGSSVESVLKAEDWEIEGEPVEKEMGDFKVQTFVIKKEGKRGTITITRGLNKETLEQTVAAAEIVDDTVARAKGDAVYQVTIPGDKRVARTIATGLTE